MSKSQNPCGANVDLVDSPIMCWKPCKNWCDLPIGKWVVKIDDSEDPYHVANSFETAQKQKCVVVGGHFHFDMATIIAYTPFQPYEPT